MLLTMAPTVAFAAVAELEREYILQRQREGIAIAKTKSQYTGRKPIPLPDNYEEVSVPRDRKSEFDPKVLRKNQTSISLDIEDVFIACTDHLTGFSSAIEAVFPKTEIQNCIIHQIRNSSKYVSYKDLKAVYTAVDEPAALDALDTFAEHWDKKYPKISQSWRDNWANLSTYFKFPQELRRLIYTTNTIEGFNRQLRKVTKSKSVFPTDDSLFKMLQHEVKTCKRCTVCAQKRRNSK